MTIKIIAKNILPNGMVHLNYTLDGLMYNVNLTPEKARLYPKGLEFSVKQNPFI